MDWTFPQSSPHQKEVHVNDKFYSISCNSDINKFNTDISLHFIIHQNNHNHKLSAFLLLGNILSILFSYFVKQLLSKTKAMFIKNMPSSETVKHRIKEKKRKELILRKQWA